MSLRCEIEGCDKEPYFNYADAKRPRFCSAHKLQGMVWVLPAHQANGVASLAAVYMLTQ